MIKESLNRGKAYPMNSYERTNRNFWKSECTLGSEIWEINSIKDQVQRKRDWVFEIASRRFQLNLYQLKTPLEVASIMFG
jgi:hypothetical protein